MVINSEAKGKTVAYDNVSQQFANASSTMNLQQKQQHPHQQTMVPMQEPAEPAFPPLSKQQSTNIIVPHHQQQQGTLSVPPPIWNKTVDEVWAKIHQIQQPLQVGANDNNLVMNSGRLRREKALQDMTLEDFLVKAGIVQESPLQFKPSPPHQPATMPMAFQNQTGNNIAINVNQAGINFASNVNQTGNFIASNVNQIGNNFASYVNQTGNN
ncbi:hypothetical protein RIF29_27514 [Crotalaria pallida]|uniref:Uncharacterized protein n=1 Tax=Crotalaria pallida TaxID=3830 RepID=A0AAN9EP77_CROPI